MGDSAPRLKLRADAYWNATPTAITAITHRGTATIAVPAADRWMDRLRPCLTGEYSIEDFTRLVDGDRQVFVRKLLRRLVDTGLVKELSPTEPTEPAGPETDQLSYFLADPSAAYQAWCATRTVVIGDPLLSAHIVAACTRSGLRSVATAAGRDAERHALPAAIDGQVVHTAARDDLPALASVEDWCADRGVPLTQVVLDGPVVWIAHGGSFTSVHGRLRQPAAGPPRQPPAAAYLVLANQVVHATLRSRTTAGAAPAAHQLTRFEWETLRTSSHGFTPVPGSRDAAHAGSPDLSARVTALLTADPPSPEAFSRAAAALADDVVGVFDKIDEADLAQLPLRVSGTTYLVPARGPGGIQRFPVWGVGIDPVKARHAAAIEAIRGYCSRFVDQSRLTVPPQAGAGPRAPTIECLDLLSGARSPVPITAVYPEPGAATSYRPPVGVAAGAHLEQAIRTGLVDLCRRHTVAELPSRTQPCPAVEIGQFAADPVVEYCAAMLTAGRAELEVYDVTSGQLRVPTVATVIDGDTVAYGCGADLARAVADGLLTATAAWQSQVNGEPDYAPGPVDQLPRRLRGEPLAGALAGAPAAALTWRELAAALAHGGRRACVVLLDHDPAVFDILPVVRVVVRGG